MKNSKTQFRSYNLPDDYQLCSNTIHLWKADYETLENSIDYFLQILDTEERQRAERYKKDLIGKRFIVFRGVLRILLAKYLSCKPGTVMFSYSNSGKPYLKNNSNDIHFNLSHTGGKAVFAFRKSVAVGIDIETINHDRECLKLAKRFFSDQEYRALEAFSKEEIETAFAKCWVRKEAFVKAVGKGLSYGLSSFSVSVTDEDDMVISHDPDVGREVAKWKLPIFYPFDDTVCSTAVYEQAVIDCFQFSLSTC